MDYMDHIITLLDRHNALGYFYKDRSDLIGFWEGAKIAWYRQNGNNSPVRVDRGTPEQEFNRLEHARYNRLRRGV